MTTYTLAGKTYTMSIEMKARLLDVIDIHEINVLAVRSGSDPSKAYAVRHNGERSTYCPCKARMAKCAHRVAVDRYLELASDERAHVEDSIRSGEFEWASCEGCGTRVKHVGYCHKCA